MMIPVLELIKNKIPALQPATDFVEQNFFYNYKKILENQESELYKLAEEFVSDIWLVEHDIKILQISSVAFFYNNCALIVSEEQRSYYLSKYYLSELEIMAECCAGFKKERAYYWLTVGQKEQLHNFHLSLKDLISRYRDRLKKAACFNISPEIEKLYEPLYADKRFTFLMKKTEETNYELVQQLPNLTEHKEKLSQLQNEHTQPDNSSIESACPNEPPFAFIGHTNSDNKTDRGNCKLKK